MFFLFRSATMVPCRFGSPTMFFTAANTPPGFGKSMCIMPGMFVGNEVLARIHIYIQSFHDGIQFAECPYEVHVGIFAPFRFFRGAGCDEYRDGFGVFFAGVFGRVTHG